MRQISLDSHPKSLQLEIALVAQSPAAISERTSIRFEREIDTLDWFDGAIVQCEGERPFGLWHYPRAPPPAGTIVLICEDIDDVTAELARVLDLVGVGDEDLLWVSPQVDRSRLQSLRGSK